jgi:hypothetical protein
MIKEDVEDVVLECEVSNTAALRLYDNLGFVRDKRLSRCGRLSCLQASSRVNILCQRKFKIPLVQFRHPHIH